ncbi:MAG TPA: protein-methionine-sulfoxide reductase heme-binding subunit MsrQ [Bacteroidota bacterium]|nr:protein-methionine-sulfoxide reductase heme-binding subunit MsrQ [Bacteroidota bacterium]
MALSSRLRLLIKAFVFAAALVPLALLIWNFFNDSLSANPLSDITNETGIWTLRFLVMTITVTPLRRVTGLAEISRYRRMLGLFAFFYGSLHFTTYIWFDKFFDWNEIVLDIPKRPFITAGFLAFSLMIPLALTSTKNMIRRMGGRKWNLLHRLVYVSAICGAVHYLWLVKVITAPQILYASAVCLLLAYRAVYSLRLPRRKPAK